MCLGIEAPSTMNLAMPLPSPVSFPALILHNIPGNIPSSFVDAPDNVLGTGRARLLATFRWPGFISLVFINHQSAPGPVHQIATPPTRPPDRRHRLKNDPTQLHDWSVWSDSTPLVTRVFWQLECCFFPPSFHTWHRHSVPHSFFTIVTFMRLLFP